MSCGCIKKSYDYRLESLDRKRLTYDDFSTWMKGPQFIVPDNYVIGVKMPTKTEPVYLEVSTQHPTMITSMELMNTTEPGILPDGIYCIQIDENTNKRGYCGKDFYKSTAVTAGLKCCRDSILASLPPESVTEDISHLDFLIEAMEVNARLNKPQKATEFYNLAKSICQRWDCNC